MVYSSLFGDSDAYFGNIVYGLDEEVAGSGTTTGACTLFINGYLPSSGMCDLFIEGEPPPLASMSGSLNLFTRGPDPYSIASGIPLYLAGPGDSGLSGIYNTTPLYISGYMAGASGSLNLYINGINSPGLGSGNMNLFLKADEPTSTGYIPLYIQNKGVSAGMPLYTIAGGFLSPTASIDPVVAGSGYGSLNLFIARSDYNEQLTLFMQGPPDTASGLLPLYTMGGVPISSGISLYTFGIDTPSGIMPLYTRGF